MVKIIVKRHLTNLVMLCTLLYASLPKQNEKFLRLLVFGFTISSEKVSRGDQKNLWILRSAEKSRVVEHCKQRDEIDKKISRRQFTRQLWYHSKKTKITVNNCWSCGCTVSIVWPESTFTPWNCLLIDAGERREKISKKSQIFSLFHLDFYILLKWLIRLEYIKDEART